MTASDSNGGRRLPKNFLTPWVLLVLKQWSLHGYLVMQQLNSMGFAEVDHPTLYRELRRLESLGYLSSEWQTDGSGPAKRVYTITDAGEEMLLGWTEVVSGYQRMINGFFDLYAQTFGATPSNGVPFNEAPSDDAPCNETTAGAAEPDGPAAEHSGTKPDNSGG